MPAQPTAAVVTVSDGVANGTREDASGDAAEELLRAAGFDVAERVVVPDERPAIEEALRRLSDAHALVVTTGGTGFGPRDVTPEATSAVIEREAPGLAELMRTAGLASTPMAALSRAVVGARSASALVVNLPGSPKRRPRVARGDRARPAARGRAARGRDRSASDRRARAAPARGRACRSAGRPDVRSGRVDVTAVKVVAGSPPCRVGMHLMRSSPAVRCTARSAARSSTSRPCEAAATACGTRRAGDRRSCTTTTATSRSTSSRTGRRRDSSSSRRPTSRARSAPTWPASATTPSSSSRAPNAWCRAMRRWRPRSRSSDLTVDDVVVVTDHDAPYALRRAGGGAAIAVAVRRDDELAAARAAAPRRAPRPGSVGGRAGPAAQPRRAGPRAAPAPRRSRCRSRPGSWPTRTSAPAGGWTDEPRRRPGEPRVVGGRQRRVPGDAPPTAEPVGPRSRWGTWEIPEDELGALGDVRRPRRAGARLRRVPGRDRGRDARRAGDRARLQREPAGRGRRRTCGDSGVRYAARARDAEELPFADASFDLVFCDHGATTLHRSARHDPRRSPGCCVPAAGSCSTSPPRSSRWRGGTARRPPGRELAPAVLRAGPDGLGRGDLGRLAAPLRRVDPAVPRERPSRSRT